jgi:hypothetical protein
MEKAERGERFTKEQLDQMRPPTCAFIKPKVQSAKKNPIIPQKGWNSYKRSRFNLDLETDTPLRKNPVILSVEIGIDNVIDKEIVIRKHDDVKTVASEFCLMN